jgi:glycosyltransferase involved in cell wall biosynthesis
MPKISVVIITYNEERNIERCLRSVLGVADDIVIVDSFSTDHTEEICLRYGARFIRNKFEGHIEQKNFAISQSSYPHILSLDADEALSAELRASILKVKENWKYDGYIFNRLTNYCGKWIRHASWYPARKLRLFDSSKGKWGGMNPHDKYILEKGSSIGFLSGDLLHFSYYSIREHIDQINKFSDILARSYLARGNRASYFTIIFHPFWRGFRDYILKAGFLDGFFGLVISVNSAHETFLKYSKLRRLIIEKREMERRTVCLFNTSQAWGGGEKWHFDVASHFHTLGYQVLVVARPGSELMHKISKTLIECRKIRISNLSFLNPWKIYQIYGMLKTGKVKTLIINLSTDLKVAGVAAHLAGVPNIIYRRGSAIPIRNSIFNRFLFGKVITEIIANSEETKRTILVNNPLLFNAERITVIYNGISLDGFDNTPEEILFARKNGEIYLGNAGRLEREKGQKQLIDVVAILRSKGYDIKVLIAGEGKLRHELLHYATSRGVKDHVVLLGFIENIKAFMESIDIFCLTSLWEGFGYVLIEAMACQKPVVAFDVRSTREIVSDGKTGFLVNDFDVNEMAMKVELLLKDKNLCKEMGMEGRKRVENVFEQGEGFRRVKKILDSPDLNLGFR